MGLQENEKAPKAFEKHIGTGIMGCLASLLLIAGIIYLGIALRDYLTDVIRAIGIFVLSAVILTIGVIGRKRRGGIFFSCVAGCGVGAVFASIFLAYGYFHLITLLGLYVFVSIWSIVAAFIGGSDTKFYDITGQLGMLVTLLYSLNKAFEFADRAKTIEALYANLGMFAVVSSFYLVYELVRHRSILSNVIINAIGLVLVFWVSDSMILSPSLREAFVIYAFLLVFALINIEVYYFGYLREKPTNSRSTGYVFYVSCLSCLLYLATEAVFGRILPRPQMAIIILIVFALIWISYGITKLQTLPIAVGESLTYFVILKAIYDMGYGEIGIPLMCIPVLLLAAYRKRTIYYILDLGNLFCYWVLAKEMVSTYILMSLVSVSLSTAFMYWKKEFRRTELKIPLFILSEFLFIKMYSVMYNNLDISRDYAFLVVITANIAICALATLSNFSKKTDSDEEDVPTRVTLMIANGIFLIAILYNAILGLEISVGAKVFVALLAIGSIMINMPYFMKTRKAVFELITVLKVYYLAALVIALIDGESFIFSCILIFLSDILIFVGFKLQMKHMRITGLVVSILAVVKLVLFDLSFDSDILHAVVVILSGIFAFAICLIYSNMVKKIENEAKELETFNRDSKIIDTTIEVEGGKAAAANIDDIADSVQSESAFANVEANSEVNEGEAAGAVADSAQSESVFANVEANSEVNEGEAAGAAADRAQSENAFANVEANSEVNEGEAKGAVDNAQSEDEAAKAASNIITDYQMGKAQYIIMPDGRKVCIIPIILPNGQSAFVEQPSIENEKTHGIPFGEIGKK